MEKKREGIRSAMEESLGRLENNNPYAEKGTECKNVNKYGLVEIVHMPAQKYFLT